MNFVKPISFGEKNLLFQEISLSNSKIKEILPHPDRKALSGFVSMTWI